MRRIIAYLVIFGLGGLFWGLAPRRTVPRAESVTSPSASTDRDIAQWQARVASDPEGVLARSHLAHALLTRFREQGDETDLALAENAAQDSLRLRRRGNTGALQALASARLARHDFRGAMTAAQRLLQQNPGSIGARHLLAEGAIEQGDNASAERWLREAAQQAPDEPYGMTLRARLLERQGQNRAALQLYQRATTIAAAEYSTPAATRAWFLGRVAACQTGMGDLSGAKTTYQEALAIFPQDGRLRTQLARVLLCQGDLTVARQELDRVDSSQPTQESAIVRAEWAEIAEDPEVARYRQVAAQGGTLRHAHDRAQALFLADHDLEPTTAVALARRDLARRHDLYAYDTLAWALLKAGRPQAAQAAITKALASGVQDATIFFHASRIATACGRSADASLFLSAALRINPRFHPTLAPGPQGAPTR